MGSQVGNPYFFHNPCTHPSLYSECTLYPHPSSSSVGHLTPAVSFLSKRGSLLFIQLKNSMEDLGNGDSFPGLRSFSCLGLVECGAKRNWPSHLTVQCYSLCDLGGPSGPWLSKGKSQPPSAPAQSEVPEMRAKKPCLFSTAQAQQKSRELPVNYLPPLYFI